MKQSEYTCPDGLLQVLLVPQTSSAFLALTELEQALDLVFFCSLGIHVLQWECMLISVKSYSEAETLLDQYMAYLILCCS